MSEQDERTGRIAAEERLRRVRIATGEWPSKTWSQDIETWREGVFGPVTARRAFERSEEEWDELRSEWSDIASTILRANELTDLERDELVEEAADVVITLCGFVGSLGRDLADEVARKMLKNRTRKWRVEGDGCGYHIEEEP